MLRLFFLFPLVFGDMCHDFCVERLGRGPCSKGSYCKRDHDCHNLFWTSETKTQICVFSSHVGECTNRYAVLCREASIGVISRIAPTTVGRTQISETLTTAEALTTSHPVGRVPTAPFAEIAYPLVVRDFVAGLIGGIYRRMMDRITAWTADTPSVTQQLRSQDNVVALELHFGDSTISRVMTHPYVKVAFQNEGRNLGYYAILDSGSDRTYIFTESESYPFDRSYSPYEPRIFRRSGGDPLARPAREGEGYRVRPGVVLRNPQALGYGVSGAVRNFESLGTINDTITVFSGQFNRFSFHVPEVHMIRPPGDAVRALLGAQQGSPFARAAEVFAVVPAPPVSSSLGSDWQLLIGRNSSHHAQVYCSPKDPNLRWFPRVGFGQWKIDGLMWLAEGGSIATTNRESRLVENIEMFLDTGGTDEVHLSPAMMETVIAELESFGARRIPFGGPYPRFENCTEAALSRNGDVLSLRIQPGTRRSTLDHPLNLYFPIVDHIEFDHRMQGQCTLRMQIGVIGSSKTVLIGTAFLSQTVTVFDDIHRRIGMCRRGYNAIEK